MQAGKSDHDLNAHRILRFFLLASIYTPTQARHLTSVAAGGSVPAEIAEQATDILLNLSQSARAADPNETEHGFSNRFPEGSSASTVLAESSYARDANDRPSNTHTSFGASASRASNEITFGACTPVPIAIAIPVPSGGTDCELQPALAVAVESRGFATEVPCAMTEAQGSSPSKDAWRRLSAHSHVSTLPFHLQDSTTSVLDEEDDDEEEFEEEMMKSTFFAKSSDDRISEGLSTTGAATRSTPSAASLARAWAKATSASAAGGGQPMPTKAEATEPLLQLLATLETQLRSHGAARLARLYVGAITAAPYSKALAPDLQRLVELAQHATELHVRRKLGRRAKKLQSLLRILPVKAIVKLLASRDANPGPTANAVLSLLLIRPLGGASVLQRLTATSLALKSRERRTRQLVATVPPPLRRALTAAIDHLSANNWDLRAAMARESAASTTHDFDLSSPARVAALLLEHARQLGDGEGLAAAAALSGQSGVDASCHAAAALASAREVYAGRAFVRMLGEKPFEETLSSLLPLFAVPLLRLGLAGDIPLLVGRALPTLESMLRVLTKKTLPPAQCDAMFTHGVSDLVGSIYEYIHRVAVASEGGTPFAEYPGNVTEVAAARAKPTGVMIPQDGVAVHGAPELAIGVPGGELLKLVAWITDSWQSLRAPVDLGFSPVSGGPLEASIAPMALELRRDHKARSRLPPQFEAALVARVDDHVHLALASPK